MDLGLKGKVAVVTGASRGLGKAIAAGLAREGCQLVICARGEKALLTAKQQITALHSVPVLAKATDLTSDGEAEALIHSAIREYGSVQLLVNNAGGNRRGKFIDVSDQDWEDILNLNVKMHLRVSRAAIPSMQKHGGGAILFVGSIFGREAGGPGLSIYNATKSALMSAAKIMALELAPDGIRVNTLAPGSIRFPGGSWDKRVLTDPEGMHTFIQENLPIGRFGTAEEIADVAAFLLSERASLVTGTCLNVDGGQSRSLI